MDMPTIPDGLRSSISLSCSSAASAFPYAHAMSSASSQPSYLIIGAGVFGAGTAYELIKKYPNADITIVDRDPYDGDNRCAASWDWNKVVRADYDDLIYCRLAVEAQKIFDQDPLWQPHFHQTGVYWMCRGNYAQSVINNFKAIGEKDVDRDIVALPPSEARKLFNGLFEDADYEGVTEVLVNKRSGWVAAGDALRAVTKKAIELGVKYEVGEVGTLLYNKQKTRCVGAALTGGKVLQATNVILAAGAYTGKLLEYSAAEQGVESLRVGDRIVAGGIVTGMHKLNDQEWTRFKDMPVGFQGYPAEVGPFMGSLPPTPDREIKWWGSHIFANTTEVLPGRKVSAPPVGQDYNQWKVSKTLQEDVRYASSLFYGKDVSQWKLEKHRVCWDAFTTSGDFIISPHSTDGLFIATCGSFHGFKFFPVLGKYVIQMMEGTMEKELVDKWAWDRERPDPALNPEWPRSELKDLQDTTARL